MQQLYLFRQPKGRGGLTANRGHMEAAVTKQHYSQL